MSTIDAVSSAFSSDINDSKIGNGTRRSNSRLDTRGGGSSLERRHGLSVHCAGPPLPSRSASSS